MITASVVIVTSIIPTYYVTAAELNEDRLQAPSVENIHNSNQDELKNLIVNGDFTDTQLMEKPWTGDIPKSWGLWIPNNIETTDYTAKVNENQELVLSSLTDEFRAAVNQRFDIIGGEQYKLSFNIKTEDKVGLARVRINERNGNDQVNLWFSRNFSGTADWQTVIQEFEPHEHTDNITVELFFETGKGTVYFDDIKLIPSIKEEEVIPLEEEIILNDSSIYITNIDSYNYDIKDQSIAINKEGLIYPLVKGETQVSIYDENNVLIKEIPLTVIPYQASTYDEMIKEWNDIIAGNDYYDDSNVVMNKQNTQLDKAVESILSEYLAHIDNENYLWSDITDYRVSANLTASYRRIESVAKQVTQSESKYYQDPVAARMVKDTLNWLYANVYNEESYIIGNWWDYEIGVPRAINNTLTLMNNYFSHEEVLKYTAPISKFVPDPYYFRVTTGNPFKALGGNLIDMGRVKIISGALREDDAIITDAILSLRQALEYASPGGEGFFRDGSYIDHVNVALTGAYGNVMIDGLSQLLPVVLKTDILVEEDLNILYDFIDRAFLPLMYKGQMMDMTRGRSISRQNLQSHAAGGEVIRGIMRVADVSNVDHRDKLTAIVKTIVTQNTYYNIFDNLHSYKDIAMMEALLNDTSVSSIERETELSIFNEMDKVVYRNESSDFAFGISMYSNTTQNYEYMNKENARGWHTADGAVYYYNDDLSHYSDNYWPTVNAYHLPGTTTIMKEREDGSGMVTLPSDFVGGTKLDDYAASVAMDFTNWNETLTAKKSWFIFGEKVVFLGSGINQTTDSFAVTTIENRKLNQDETYELFVNGDIKNFNFEQSELEAVNSILLSNPSNSKMNIGYVFLEETDLKLSHETRSGSWQDINAAQSDTVYSNEFLMFYQEHKRSNDAYAYVMYPNITNSQLQVTVENNSIEILRNDETIQAVYDHDAKQWGIVLYEDVPFSIDDDFTFNKKGIYSMKLKYDHYIVSYYDPTDQALGSSVDLEIDSLHGYDIVKVSTESDRSTIVQVPILGDANSNETIPDVEDNQSEDDESLENDNQEKESDGIKEEGNTTLNNGSSANDSNANDFEKEIANNKTLPLTATHTLNLIFLGALALSLGSVLMLYKKKVRK
ncbi:polysaccharide lyase 8 family protein [Halolactibacillus alkaliphilus]|nr:polysaccharide lyase 8 family protein [Halolactibacillus alkaliphilus]